MSTPNGVRRLAKAFAQLGGRALLIGGGVIDTISNREVKDWDIEVYGLSMQQIEDCLTEMGLTSDMVGQAFGIIKTNIDGLDIDLSVPRRENKVGVGHKGFEVELDPSMTPKEAGRRRDLTINSMYLDIETEEIVDPFNGMKDLEAGVIRATDPNTFREDPLRVLRVMQILPRKGNVVDSELISLCREMENEFSTLPKERVFEEFKKLLLKAEKPSTGIKFLVDSQWINHFPELKDLIGCPQNPEHHPEGNVFVHSMMVLDMAARLRDRVVSEWRLGYMFGALLHDVGKPSTTREDFTAYGHESAGIPIARTFMERITDNKQLIQQVELIVGNHMTPGQLDRSKAKTSAWKRLHNRIRLDVIALMSRADSTSRFGDSPDQPHSPSEKAFAYFEKFGEKPIPKILQGRHLIAIGMKPGKEFGVVLREAYSIQIEEGLESPDEILDRLRDIHAETPEMDCDCGEGEVCQDCLDLHQEALEASKTAGSQATEVYNIYLAAAREERRQRVAAAQPEPAYCMCGEPLVGGKCIYCDVDADVKH